MFDIGFGEMILLAAIALIAIGPKQLPEVARAVGKLIGEIKKTVGEVTSTVATARDETDRAIRKVTDDLRNVTSDISSSIQKQPESQPVVQRDPAIHEPIPIIKLPDHPGNWKPEDADPDVHFQKLAAEEAAAKQAADQKAEKKSDSEEKS